MVTSIRLIPPHHPTIRPARRRPQPLQHPTPPRAVSPISVRGSPRTRPAASNPAAPSSRHVLCRAARCTPAEAVPFAGSSLQVRYMVSFSTSVPTRSFSRSPSATSTGTFAPASRSTRSVNSERRCGIVCSASVEHTSRQPNPASGSLAQDLGGVRAAVHGRDGRPPTGVPGGDRLVGGRAREAAAPGAGGIQGTDQLRRAGGSARGAWTAGAGLIIRDGAAG